MVEGVNADKLAALAIRIADTVNGSDLLSYPAVHNAGTAPVDVDDGSGTGHPDGGVGIEDLPSCLLRHNAGC